LKKLGFTSAQIYDAEEKQEAREELHSILARESGGTLLILPGPRDHETRTAMRNGWALDRILLVDKSAAVLALHTRNFTKRERPLLQRYTGLVSDVAFRLARRGKRISATHIDFCQPIFALIAGSPAIEIPKIVQSGVMDEGLLAITVESGHDPGCYSNDERYLRMTRLVKRGLKLAVTPRTAELFKQGEYTNPRSNNTMLWAVFQIRRK
jgi:hypothetical protein